MAKDLEKVSLRLFEGDSARLASYYPRMGYQVAIRELVRAHLKKLDAKAAEAGINDALEDLPND